jgi:glucoamylase
MKRDLLKKGNLMKLHIFAVLLSLTHFHLSKASTQAMSEALSQQYSISTQAILKNLPTQNDTFGSVAASPTQQYQFHWTRDAALTWQSLLKVYKSSHQTRTRTDLLRRFEAWVKFEKRAVKNAIAAGYTQGEPKFLLNALPYTGEWGRPQNDGPALRSLVMAEWAFQLLSEGRADYVRNELYRPELPSNALIKSDLEFTAQKWQEASFDPWEEVKGLNYYSLAMQRKSLLLGAELAKQMNDPAAADYYLKTAQNMLFELKLFSDPNRGYVIATRKQVDGWTHKTSQLDVAVVLATVQGPLDFEYMHYEIKNLQKTVDELENSFRKIYSINRNQQTAVIGRYPEDVYDGFGFSGGNPWFLTTHAYAEYYCKLAQFSRRSQSRYLDKGREYLVRVLKHRNQQTGEMSEQISRENGYLTGVSHLTWSYASFITAMHACYPQGL